MKKKYSLFLILICFFILGVFLNFFKTELNFIHKEISTESHRKMQNNECNNQWIIVNDKVFFRSSLFFFYEDISEIRLFLLKEIKFVLNFNIDLILIDSNKEKTFPVCYFDFINLNTAQKSVYGFLKIKTNFLKESYSPNAKFFIQIKYNNDSKVLIEKLPLEKKIYNVDFLMKKSAILCSRIFTFGNQYTLDFEWWFKINIKNGLEKIVFYNGSLGSGNAFHELFKKYEKHIEVIQIDCLPNFDFNEKKSKFLNFKDFYWSIPHRYLFEIFTYNDCYQRYHNKYKYILVSDQDEVIIPREELKYLDTQGSFISQHSLISKINGKKFGTYVRKIKDRMKLTDVSSLYFKMGFYFDEIYLAKIFNKIKSIVEKHQSFPNSTSIIHLKEKNKGLYDCPENNLYITISNHKEFEYSKYLLSLYLNKHINFINKNREKLKNLENLNYMRFFLMVGNSTLYFGGKTVHDTRLTKVVTHHLPLNYTPVTIPLNIGFVSHFRKNFQCFKNTHLSIGDIIFDFEYFENYFKPISNDLSYNLEF